MRKKKIPNEPCPFCESSEKAEYNGAISTDCGHCGASGPDWKATAKDANEAWNKRPRYERLLVNFEEAIYHVSRNLAPCDRDEEIGHFLARVGYDPNGDDYFWDIEQLWIRVERRLAQAGGTA